MQNHVLSDYLAEKKIFAKGPEFWHVGFVLPKKHCSEFFFAGLLFVVKILRMQTTLSFPSGIFWRSTCIYLTLSETLQISHVDLIRCVKECSACFLAEVCLVFEMLRMQKTVVCGHVSM